MIESQGRLKRSAAGRGLGLGRYAVGLSVLWTLALGASLWWGVSQERKEEMAAAAITARVSYESDIKYLSWLSALGGLYVHTEEPFPPDPHLGDFAARKIRLPDGSDLMPLTPIYVLRLVHALDIEPLEVSSRLRSLTPVVLADVPDPWEKRALGELARGRREVAEIGQVEGEKCLRLMMPLQMGKDCVSCHVRQGYREGTLQGGISVAVPMDRPAEFGRRRDTYLFAVHGILWLFGLGFIGYGFRNLAASAGARDRALLTAAEERAFSDSVVETAGALMLVTDPEGRIVRFNRACETATGYRLDEVLGAPVWELLLAPEDRDSWREEFSPRGAASPMGIREVTWLKKDGCRRVIAWAVSLLRDDQGEMKVFIASGVDVTERRHTEEALRESEERYRTLVENIDLGIAMVDEGNRTLTANSAHRRLTREFAPETGMECHGAGGRRGAVFPDCPGIAAMGTGKPEFRESGGIRHDGSPFWVRVQAFPVLAPEGAAKGFIEVVEDFTEAKRMQDEREQLERKMLQAQKLESLGILAGGIAHDFNNLLMGILGNVDLALLKSVPESPARPYLQKIELTAQRAAELTNQMLAYSGRGHFVVESIDVSRLVSEMEHLLRTVLSKAAAVRFELAADLPAIVADATQLRQVVMNLITNASDSLGGDAGTITMSTGTVDADSDYFSTTHFGESLPAGRYVYVQVSDTGCGMDRETRARIFDPFFTTKEAGRGLGLAAVLGIVRGHKGALTVHSEADRGTTFRVYFPSSGLAAAREPAAPELVESAQLLPGLGGAILVVDDEDDVRSIAQSILEDRGFRVLTASDGVEAVDLFRSRSQEIAVVILDMTMPRMGGEDAFREMRAIREDVAVILSSGYAEQDSVNRSARGDEAGFIQKPYRVQTLLDKLKEVTGTGPRGDVAGRS